MIPTPTLRRLAWPSALLAIALAAPAARGQGFDDEDDEDEAAGAMNPHMAVYTDENFDQWVFGNGRNYTSFRASVDSLLAMQIEELDRACGLTDAQRAKLMLAGRGDLKRILDAYDDKKKKFRATGGDQNRINEIFQDIQPLQQAIAAGPFGESSIFAKSIGKTLDPAQAERFEKVAKEKRTYRYRARVELAVNLLDGYVGMTADQRRRLVQVIVDETRSPRKFGRQDYQVVILLASKVPEARLRPIFDDAQWKKVRRQMDGVRGLETYLRTNGFLPDETEAKK
ncbi:MAG TPA: hypothetical protein VG406_26280 [Isosphaeraceae bacterium]|nr:hypothetical protein [Isosphaeraceae bacterium]